MKTLSKILLIGIIAFMLFSCSENENTVAPPTTKYYKLPSEVKFETYYFNENKTIWFYKDPRNDYEYMTEQVGFLEVPIYDNGVKVGVGFKTLLRGEKVGLFLVNYNGYSYEAEEGKASYRIDELKLFPTSEATGNEVVFFGGLSLPGFVHTYQNDLYYNDYYAYGFGLIKREASNDRINYTTILELYEIESELFEK